MKLLKIGSNSENDIVINDDDSVSQFHAELFWDGKDILVISDKESTNGTFVNGRRIHDAKRLKELDIVKVGGKLIDWNSFIYDDSVTVVEVENTERKQSQNSKPTFMSKYFSFNDGEYISGARYFYRTLLQYPLIVLFGLGLYLQAVTCYKRGKSLNNKGEGSVLWGIYGFVRYPIGIAMSFEESLVILQLLLFGIPHLYLWFSNGNPELKIQS